MWRQRGCASPFSHAWTFPVPILTARGIWTEKVERIDASADDYMAKPFAMGEVIARLRGLLRRAAGRVSAAISVGPLTLDTARMEACVDGQSIRLSQLEFRFLQLLCHQPGHLATPHHIATMINAMVDDIGRIIVQAKTRGAAPGAFGHRMNGNRPLMEACVNALVPDR